MNPADVIVVGAGPTGLMLACELALAGVRCRVLERRAGQPNITRAFAIHARTLELLDARKLADDLVPRGLQIRAVQTPVGGRLDLQEVDTRYQMVLMVPQSATEHLLEARAKQLGVDLVYGAEVVTLHQDAEGVDLEVDGPAGVRNERARYVVGCDGAHSTVRRLIGVDFAGEQYETHIMLADVPLSEPPEDGLFGRFTNEGAVLIVPFGGGWFRMIAWDRQREQVPLDVPLDAAEMRDAFARIAGTDFGMGEPRWSTRFLSERRQAKHYRVGRVFLAGDAAHVHSPLGGQGMNIGIQDAINLGWKLAAAVQGWGPSWLLDSYEEERHPVGAQVLKVTDRFNQLVLGGSELRRTLWTIMTWLLIRVARSRRMLQGQLTGISIAYPPRTRGGSRWAGRRIPDLHCDHGRLYEQMRAGGFVLVDMTAAGSAAQAAAPWSDRVRAVRASRQAGLPAVVLVRPDGYIAWASDKSDDTISALTTWCGRAPRADGGVEFAEQVGGGGRPSRIANPAEGLVSAHQGWLAAEDASGSGAPVSPQSALRQLLDGADAANGQRASREGISGHVAFDADQSGRPHRSRTRSSSPLVR